MTAPDTPASPEALANLLVRVEGELSLSRDPSPTDDGGDQCRPAASLATAECSVCAGGWPNYFRLILARQYAGVCETHIAENAAERDRAKIAEGE